MRCISVTELHFSCFLISFPSLSCSSRFFNFHYFSVSSFVHSSCPFHVASFVLWDVYCVLCTVYCILCTVCCLLGSEQCVLCTEYCMLCIECCILHTVYCVLRIVYGVLYIAHVALCTVSCVLCTVNIVLHTVCCSRCTGGAEFQEEWTCLLALGFVLGPLGSGLTDGTTFAVECCSYRGSVTMNSSFS